MAVIKCKMCGGDLVLVEGQSVAECEYCGSRQTVPSSDNEKKLIQFERAERLRKNCEFDKAAGLYEAIVSEFRQEAEAYWGMVLCKYGIEYVDDPATGKKIPTCHRSSFDSILEDSDFEQALENADSVAWRVYREEAKQIEQIRKGIIAVSANEAPYDVFICYKETDENGDRTLDSVLAQDIYDALTEKGYRTFFARITLEDKLGQEYEPYIFAALNSAKIMLAVGTDYEFYNAVWVKNEWSRYLKLMTKDKTKHLIPCFKGIDAYDMPREFAKLQAQDMGKVGAMQDLLRGIEKILPKQKNTTVIQEKVVVGAVGGNNKVTALLERGNMALEDGDWAKADSFFEDVLNNDAKNAQAYIGKTLAQEKCRTMDALVRKRRDVYQNVRTEELEIPERTAYISGMVEKFALPGYLEAGYLRTMFDVDRTYDSEVAGRKQQYQDEKNWWANHKLLSRAEKFATGSIAETLQREKKHLFAQLKERIKQAEQADAKTVAEIEKEYDLFLAETNAQAEKLYQDALARREQNYKDWLEQAKKETEPGVLLTLADAFVSLDNYKDSKNLADRCLKRAEEEQDKLDEAEARRRIRAEQQRKAQQKRVKNIAILSVAAVVLAIAVVLVVTKVIIPANNYKKAEELLENGKTAEAAMAFGAMGDYKDAEERSLRLWEEIAQRDTVSAESVHTAGLKADGTVVAVGYNSDGQCAVSDWKDIIAISAGGFHTVGLKADGTVVAVGDNDYGRCAVSDWKDIIAISAGYYYTVGLKADGTVVAVGANDFGECNVSNWTDIKLPSISEGQQTAMNTAKQERFAKEYAAAEKLAENGETAKAAIAFGKLTDYKDSRERSMELWNNVDHLQSINVGESGHTVALKSDGTVVAVGKSDDGRLDVQDWKDIVSVSAGAGYTVGLKSDGTVLAIGYDDNGRCDVEDWQDIISINTGLYHTVGIKSDGTVVAAGTINVSNSTESDKRVPNVGSWKDIVKVCGGKTFTLGLRADGTVVSDGSNYFGQCNVTDWENIVSIDAGEGHSVGVKADGTVVAVGYNIYGQCNVQDWKDIVSVCAGKCHTVGLKSDGTVVAIGWDKYGQCDVSEWKDIVAIDVGASTTVGIKADGTVIAIGWDEYGQCDVADWKNIKLPQ